jgi:hypothetical protein
MEILITDVTEMGGGKYCVAGWDNAAKRMVRPLPNGNNWTTALLDRYKIVTGQLVQIEPQGTSSGGFPHRTEDTPINQASIKATDRVFSDWLGPSAPAVAADLNTGFCGQLQWNGEWNGVKQGVHTPPGVQCSSLVAVRVPKANLSFAESFHKLRAILNDGSDRYQFTVSSKVLKEAWRSGGLAAVNNALPGRDDFHIRIGLARPFGNPQKCYAMLNGVL